MNESDCINFCPGVDCPPECAGYSNSMSDVVGSPASFTGGMFSDAQQYFTDWGGVSLAAAIALGSVLSMVFKFR